MKFVGLTGGIGTGKSTVRQMLAARGAAVMDVDHVSRELQQPGQPFFDEIVNRWGAAVIGADGQLDRRALSRIVFHDKEQLAELTRMAAPVTETEIVKRAARHLGTDAVVIVEAAMFRQLAYGMTGLMVVDAPVEVAVSRLVRARGMAEADARARIALQLPREVRLGDAGFVIDNSGTADDLGAQVDQAWAWILELPDATPRLAGA